MTKKIVLEEDEWNLLCDRSIDETTGDNRCTALPVCCANVSALRDQIVVLRKNDGRLTEKNKKLLLQGFDWVGGCHNRSEWDWTILDKIMDQVKAD